MRTNDYNDFVAGYIECMIWADCNEDQGFDDSNYDDTDLAEETLQSIRSDCLDFLTSHGAEIDALDYRPTDGGTKWGWAGHDFYLTRNGHGAGFWDRGFGKAGERLTAACRPYGGDYPYLGDDGKIYTTG